MFPVTDSFTFDDAGSELVYGRGRIDDLGGALAERGFERALVVCGSNVGANEAVMGPIRRSLGDRLAGVFDGTTPAKMAGTAYDCIEATRDHDADVLVAVGGGSSLDVARLSTILAADGRTHEDLLAEARAEGAPAPARGREGASLTPTVVVPTTFAGADVSASGSLVVSPADEPPVGQVHRIGADDERARPEAMFYDPDLFETTPEGPLVGSAMNGFDKGVETVYSGDPDPITDATAVHGLRLLVGAFPRLGDDPDAMDRAVLGIVLVQFRRRTSLVHAFGHGLARRYPVQQGVAHAVIVPGALSYLLSEVDARRTLLAEGLGLDPDRQDLAEAIVDAVVDVRDGLGLPSRLRELDPVEREDFPAIAEFVREDPLVAGVPDGLDVTTAALEGILEAAW